jgi:putative endonuclease
MFYVYILYSKKLQKFYTGQTENIKKRIEEHNRGKTAFNKKGLPWELIYQKEYNTRSEAMQHEKRIKKRGASRFLSDNGIVIG